MIGHPVSGVVVDPSRRRRGRIAVVAASVVLALTLVAGSLWVKAERAADRRSISQAIAAVASATDSGAASTIELRITDSSWVASRNQPPSPGASRPALTPMISDHGKLMHMFVVSDDLRAFAHLNPSTSDTVRFTSWRPPLPGGAYHVYGNVVHESGFAQTLTAPLVLRPQTAEPSSGSRGDDSWHVRVVAVTSAATSDRETMIEWKRGTAPLIVGRPAPLRFVVSDLAGNPAVLEPYMGMAAHAVVMRADRSVFMHLFPSETATDTISFRYAFPAAGRYRIWVQVKRGGRVVTGAFDAEVAGGA